LPPSNTTRQTTRVIEEFDFPREESIVKYFKTGIDTMSHISGDLAKQVDQVKQEAENARAHMKEWTDRVVTNDKEKILKYVQDLSEAADELQNAEAEFVGLCDTAAQLLKALGEELERKIVSAESTRISQDIKDEQKLMSKTIGYTEDKLERIKKQFQFTKSKFHTLSATSEWLSMKVEDEIEQLRNQKNHWEGGLAAGFVGAAGVCGSTVAFTLMAGGAAAPTLVFCGAAVMADGAVGVHVMRQNFENSKKRLKDCQGQFDNLEQKCDNLGGLAETDQKRLVKVQSSVHAEGVLMSISTLVMWKHQVLPKNKELVKQLQDVVGKYK